jgi:hypothetical protein
MMQRLIDKAGILIEALPYIQSFDGKVVVIKLGGSAMSVSGCTEGVLKDVVFMEAVGMRPVLVHGGGLNISACMKKADHAALHSGAVTDAATSNCRERCQINRGLGRTIRISGKAPESVPAEGRSGRTYPMVKGATHNGGGHRFRRRGVAVSAPDPDHRQGHPGHRADRSGRTRKVYNINGDVARGDRRGPKEGRSGLPPMSRHPQKPRAKDRASPSSLNWDIQASRPVIKAE